MCPLRKHVNAGPQRPEISLSGLIKGGVHPQSCITGKRKVGPARLRQRARSLRGGRGQKAGAGIALAFLASVIVAGLAAGLAGGWTTQPPGAPGAESRCPAPGQWLLLYWNNPPRSIEDAARSCPTADRFWAYEGERWRGFSPDQPGASDAWLVALGAAAFLHGAAPAANLGAELVGTTVRVPGSLGRGQLDLTVTEVRTVPALLAATGVEQRARGVYLVLFLRAVNTGPIATQLGIYSFYLSDAQGRAFTLLQSIGVQPGAEAAFRRPGLLSPIPAAESQDLVIVFDVPLDAAGLRLRPGSGLTQITESAGERAPEATPTPPVSPP